MTSYTPAQRDAIACLDEPLQIIACAGSGKTQVISQRIADILALPGIEPRNIVAFTFTDRAAAELKDRVLGIVTATRPGITGMAEMYIGTMHGYCRDLLQRLVPETFKFSVLEEITTRLLVDRTPGQGNAVAGGIHSLSATQPVSLETTRRFGCIPRCSRGCRP